MKQVQRRTIAKQNTPRHKKAVFRSRWAAMEKAGMLKPVVVWSVRYPAVKVTPSLVALLRNE